MKLKKIDHTFPKRLRKGIVRLLIVLVMTSAVLMASAVGFFRVFFGRFDETGTEPAYAADLNRPRREVRFDSGGNQLAGYFYGEHNQKGVVIFAHGFHGSADTHLAEIFYFVEHGWVVFSFDSTGTRDSAGSGTYGFPQMKLDLGAAIDYVSSVTELPLVLYGHSNGAYASAAVLGDEPRVKAAVCIAGFDRPMELMLYQGRAHLGFLADVGYPFLYLENRLLFGRDANCSAAEAINASEAAVLIVSGTADTVVPEAVSLYGCADQIDNPRVHYLLIEEEYRNQHSTAWLTSEAARLQLEGQGQQHQLDEDFMAQMEAFLWQNAGNG